MDGLKREPCGGVLCLVAFLPLLPPTLPPFLPPSLPSSLPSSLLSSPLVPPSSQFATAQEELLRLLNDFIKILRNRALPYAQEIKVLHAKKECALRVSIYFTGGLFKSLFTSKSKQSEKCHFCTSYNSKLGIYIYIEVYMRKQVCSIILSSSFSEVLELCAGTSQVDSLNVPKLVDKYLQACLQPTKHSATGEHL